MAVLVVQRAGLVCLQDNIALCCKPLDTSSFSLRGDYVPESDEQALPIYTATPKTISLTSNRPCWTDWRPQMVAGRW
jgi:hypothetical protein